MKKYIGLALALTLMASCADEKKETTALKSDLESYKLNGPVEKASEKSFKFENGSEVPGNEIASAHNTDLIFDENGALIVTKQWIADGSPYQEETYEGKDKLIKKIQYINGQPTMITENQWDKAGTDIVSTIRRNPDNSPIDKILYTFKNNRLAEKATYNAQDNPLDKTVFAYDKAGNIVREDIYQGAAILKAYAVYGYDADGNKITEARYNADKSLQYKTTYKYDGDKLAGKITTDAKGQKELSETLEHDSKGNLTTRIAWESFENAETVEKYSYDSNGNILTWSVEKNGAPEIAATYAYDKNNNVLISKQTGNNGAVAETKSYTYQYDKYNNWTEKKITINDKPSFIVKRTLKYKG